MISALVTTPPWSVTICVKFSVSLDTSSSAVGSTMKTTSYCLFVSKSNLPLHCRLPISNFRFFNWQLAIGNRQLIKFAHCFQSAVPDDRSYRVRALVQYFCYHCSLTF